VSACASAGVHGLGEPASAPYFTKFVPGRKGEILDAALTVFAEKGYEAGTMREIAARVGVSEPALYRHYAGKEALLLDLVATAGSRINAEAKDRIQELDLDNLRESLRQLIHWRRHGTSDNKNIMRTLMDAAPHNVAMRETFKEQFGRPMIDSIREFIVRIDDSFSIERAPEDLEGKLRAFMSIFIGYFMTSMFFGNSTSDDAIVDAMMAIMNWDASNA
jgi:AcrR family transcriptional regulator